LAVKLFLRLRFATENDAESVVHEPIENDVGERRIAKCGVPALNRNL
jgi:hypothetical protein